MGSSSSMDYRGKQERLGFWVLTNRREREREGQSVIGACGFVSLVAF